MQNTNAIFTIAYRDIAKLLKDRTRIMASFIFPIIFIGILGTSLQQNLADGLGYNFLVFVLTGVLGQTLFQSTSAGIISLVEDRQNDFAQEMFIAPISRYSILIGKILGETLVSFVQIIGIIIFGYIMGIPFYFCCGFFWGSFWSVCNGKYCRSTCCKSNFSIHLIPSIFSGRGF
jgi:ABC-2 type transport system permease protein